MIKEINADLYKENYNFRIGKFHKVSFPQFKKDWIKTFDHPNTPDDEFIRDEKFIDFTYKLIKLPARATEHDAGYDFMSPLEFVMAPGEEVVIPTGIRAEITPGWFLMACPKSGLGFKYYVKFANTIGIVDSGYYFSDNEGHIFVKLRNEGRSIMKVDRGDKLFQGIFCIHGITFDDNATGARNGGFGSTGK